MMFILDEISKLLMIQLIERWNWAGQLHLGCIFYSMKSKKTKLISQVKLSIYTIAAQQPWNACKSWWSQLYLIFRIFSGYNQCSQKVFTLTKRPINVAGVTVLLSLTVFMNIVSELMPITSDAVPLIGNTTPLSKHNANVCVYWQEHISTLSREWWPALLCSLS